VKFGTIWDVEQFLAQLGLDPVERLLLMAPNFTGER